MPLVVGVDSSTQSTTVEIRDADGGEIVARASSPHPATTPPASEQHPVAWASAFDAAYASASGAVRGPAPAVAAVAVAAQQHGMVALDAEGAVVRPALLWNDTRSAPDATWLREQLDDDAWADAVGSVPVAAFTVAKLSWLHRNEPQHWARTEQVALPHDWLTARLCGTLGGPLTTDRGDASGTGYWSPATRSYRPDVLAIVDPERDWALPRVAGPLDAVGAWEGAIVAPGTGDNMAAALGLAVSPGEAVVSVGTSGTVYARSPVPVADPTGAVAGFADATGEFLPLVCTLNGAKVLDAVRRLLGVDHEELDRLALAPAAPGGPTLVPFFDGERVPDLPTATGRLVGLRSDVSREQLARAAVEGVACGLLDGLDALRRHVTVGGPVVLTGGAARSRAVRALVAGLCDLPVVSGPVEESVAAGACVQAAAVLAQDDPVTVAARWGLDRRTPIEPAPIDAAEVRGRHSAAVDELAEALRRAPGT